MGTARASVNGAEPAVPFSVHSAKAGGSPQRESAAPFSTGGGTNSGSTGVTVNTNATGATANTNATGATAEAAGRQKAAAISPEGSADGSGAGGGQPSAQKPKAWWRTSSWWRQSPWWRGGPVIAAVVLALAVHKLWPVQSFVGPDPLYGWLLQGGLVLWILFLALVPASTRLRSWVIHYGPLLTVGALLLVAWEVSTAKLALLPMPYFPGPDRVLSAFREDGEMLAVSALHSFRLLGLGYVCGASLGFLIGLTMGWSKLVRYWGTPLLKTLGPVPAPAWIPVAMIIFPTSFQASTSLVALASLFPMIVLTSSGITSVRQSHLEVARMLGASPRQLIWRVAIPSALPTIFVGLFQALGASFLTLIVAEMVGVKAGLGWYITWAQNYMEYYKVAAALIIMSLFFSGIMTALFKVRDRVLRWQQGLIKW